MLYVAIRGRTLAENAVAAAARRLGQETSASKRLSLSNPQLLLSGRFLPPKLAKMIFFCSPHCVIVAVTV